MPTIGFDATAAARQSAGIGRYARELLIGLERLGGNDHYRLVVSSRGAKVRLPELGPRFRTYSIPLSDRVTNAAWHRLHLPVPIEARIGRVDVFHSPDFSLAPSIAPSIMTVHDLAFEIVPQFSFPTLAAYLHRVVPRCVKRAAAVIVPSAHVKNEISAKFGTDPAKITVIPEGVSSGFDTEPRDEDSTVLRRLGVDQTPYLLTVGTIEPRKNLERLMEAYAALRSRTVSMPLLLVGRPGWLYADIYERHARLGLGDSVRFLTDVEDQDLAVLYRHAHVTICAALYEGFGLPVLEALASGSALACSGNTSMPDIAGEAACYFDPWDVEDMVETILRLIENEDLRHRLRVSGPIHAREFSWTRAAEATSHLDHQIMAN